MTPENIPPSPENRATSKKTTIPKPPPQEQPLKCPRCDSSNTKFCYYNNYSLTQPRHFCKTCRRYWTRGGALRSVPIGGGCRKATKKLKTTAATSTTTTNNNNKFGGGEFGPAGFKFLGSNLNPGTEFNLGGLSPPRLHPATAGVYTQFISSSVPAVTGCGPYFGGLDLMGLSNHHTTTMSPSVTSSLVIQGVNNEQQNPISSIESLSSINQEMHWKLQQQRLGLMFQDNKNNNDQEKTIVGGINLFNNLEINNNSNNNNNNNNMHGVWGDLHQHNHEEQLQFHGLQ
ncbi:hypothetical protein vseg_019250 [Gypsophila vaccaria]